jgi:hypothetical protein
VLQKLIRMPSELTLVVEAEDLIDA